MDKGLHVGVINYYSKIIRSTQVNNVELNNIHWFKNRKSILNIM